MNRQIPWLWLRWLRHGVFAATVIVGIFGFGPAVRAGVASADHRCLMPAFSRRTVSLIRAARVSGRFALSIQRTKLLR
jgi:hypothetical protein